MDETTFRQQLGVKLKKLRELKGLDLRGVASASGVEEELIRQYEEGQAMPALGELMSLAKAFDVNMSHFFLTELSQDRIEVVRASERWKVTPQSDTAATLNYSYEALSYRLTEKMMSPFFIEIPPSKDKPVEPLSHEGEEFLFIVSGDVEIKVGQETHRLSRGDAIYFDSRIKHSVRALGSRPVRMVACLVNVHRPPNEHRPMDRAY